MLRIYACVVAAVLGVIAIAAAVRISIVGLGVSVLYLSSAAIFAYRGLFAEELYDHSECCSSDGLVFLAYGTVGSAHHERPRVPFPRKGLGSGASARGLRWIDDGMRSVVTL